MVKSPSVGVAGLLVQDGRVLMGRRGHDPHRGTWAFPGGRLELGERLEDGVRREFFEETGLRVVAEYPLYIAELLDDAWHFIVIDFLVANPEGVLRPGSDMEELRWIGAEDWPDLTLAQGMARCLSSPDVRKALGWV